MGPTNPHLVTIAISDPPDAWRAAGFSVDERGRCRLGATTLALGVTGPSPVVGWALEGVDASVAGLPTCARVEGGPDRHPNGVVSIDHVVVHAERPAAAVTGFEAAGFDLRGTRTTTSYGSVMDQHFFWAGDVIVELIGPAEEPADADPTSGAAFVGLALVAEDLDATAAHLGELLSGPKDAVQPGRRIGGLRGGSVGITVPLVVMSPHPAGGPTRTDPD